MAVCECGWKQSMHLDEDFTDDDLYDLCIDLYKEHTSEKSNCEEVVEFILLRGQLEHISAYRKLGCLASSNVEKNRFPDLNTFKKQEE
jgi:hypothetical protein